MPEIKTCEIPTSRWPYEKKSWDRRKRFTDLLGDICKEEDVELTWTSAEMWSAIIQKDDRKALLDGYVFPLNDAATARVTNNKSDTDLVLRKSGIDVVEHYFISPYEIYGERRSIQSMANLAIGMAGLPLVLKPNADVSGGGGVKICESEEEVARAIAELSAQYGPLAASPFLEFDEYRTIVLDGEPLLTYEKIRAPGQLLHNLGHGAKAEIVTDPNRKASIEGLAVTSLAAVNGRFASVDTVVTEDGRKRTLEINDGVALGHFGEDPANHDIVKHIYTLAVRASLN